MTEAQATTSLTEHVRALDTGAHVVAAAFVDGAPTLALADGAVLIGEPGEQKRVVSHPDAAILAAISDGKTILTGGDDVEPLENHGDSSSTGAQSTSPKKP